MLILGLFHHAYFNPSFVFSMAGQVQELPLVCSKVILAPQTLGPTKAIVFQLILANHRRKLTEKCASVIATYCKAFLIYILKTWN